MAEIVWPERVLDVYFELPDREQAMIQDRLKLIASFPEMYAVRGSGRFRGNRHFVAGSWVVYYKYRGGTVYVRGLWPARIP